MDKDNQSISDFEIKLLCEIHLGLERQGPGSPEMTIKALSFIENLNKPLHVADMGCGTGGQTMTLAQNIAGNVTGIDFFPEFINIFNENAKKLDLLEKVSGITGSMDDLPFQKDELDLIWSEGAIANIGFEKGLNYWKGFLKKGGYVAVTYESWFTDEERPAEIEKWWFDAVPEINTIGHNVSVMQQAGYIPVAVFTLPEKCWTDYFTAREAAGQALLEKYSGNETVKAFVANMEYEAQLYSKYKQYYGYAFYIGRKI